MRYEDVLHARLVLDALHEPAAARRDDFVLGGAEKALQDGVLLSQRVQQRLSARDGTRSVLLPRGDVGLARRFVCLEVAETLALLPQAGSFHGVGGQSLGWWPVCRI